MAADSVEHFAAEAEDARDRIASTIDEIQDRLDPRRVINSAAQRVSDGSSHLVGQARDTVRQHPLALGAGIAAIAVALFARNKLSHARVDMGDANGDYTDYDDGFGLAEVSSARLYDDEDGYGETAAGARAEGRSDGRAARRARALAARTTDTVADNPMVSIVIGLIAGAALGALFPTTEAERRAFGDTGARLGAAAGRAVGEVDFAGGSFAGAEVEEVPTRARA